MSPKGFTLGTYVLCNQYTQTQYVWESNVILLQPRTGDHLPLSHGSVGVYFSWKPQELAKNSMMFLLHLETSIQLIRLIFKFTFINWLCMHACGRVRDRDRETEGSGYAIACCGTERTALGSWFALLSSRGIRLPSMVSLAQPSAFPYWGTSLAGGN